MNLVQRLRPHRVMAFLTLIVLTASAFVALVVVPSPQAASATPIFTSSTSSLSDDFTRDTSLNASLWQINGTVGSVLGPKDTGMASLVTLEPAFSSMGMEIAQVNDKYEAGTIQSIESFTPPFTVTAVVEGTVSNGHTFGFAIASANATSGVLMYGNLNDTDCSHLGDCSDPSVCGISANSAIPPNQCYYGINAKIGQGGNWTGAGGKTKLYLTPSVNVFYTLQISVDASGIAHYSVSQGGQVLGNTGTAQIGTTPFYIILEQAEGAPVGSGRANQAYWMSVSLAPTTVSSTTTSSASTTSTTSTSPSPGPFGITVDIWIALVVVIIILFLIILLWYSGRRKFTVIVQDSQSLSPIAGAIVSAVGPKDYTGTADDKGRTIFANPKEGDYSVQAKATGYNTSIPAKVKVKKDKTEYVVKLDRAERGQPGQSGAAPSEGPGPQPQVPPLVAQPTPAPTAPAPARPATPQPSQPELPEFEGWGGERIRQIIRTFQEKGAISPETALTAEKLGLSRLFVRIMKRRKGRTVLFIEVNGRYYLNQEALKGMK